MDPSTDVLADAVRAKRSAIDNDLELLRLKAQSRVRAADPRRYIDVEKIGSWGRVAVPVAAGAVALMLWRRRRRSVTSLQDLLAQEAVNLLHIEKQLLPKLRRFAAEAANPDLKSLFERHADETGRHVERITRILRSVGGTPRHSRTDTVDAVNLDARKVIKRVADANVRDAWLIGEAQRLEHLEIARYGTACAHAHTLGHVYAAQLLEQSLGEEKVMDQQLTDLAVRFVNPATIR